ncbi:CDP-diacylglycerol--serine O-phosphatidyltransferase [Desulfovibrio sp. OttesenSCG-928-F07]|nr:CDP-diacylglycerol--serine O-phosphatidyltransferase [Desulfovibrio sp. OttesenSCG-928-F07]
MTTDKQNRTPRRGVYILPNMATAGSVFVAFLGILWAVNGAYTHCALAILGSALLDGMDGKIARLTNTASDFGVQMDSLADAVAFGVTPGIMVYLWQLQRIGDQVGLAVSFLFIICGILRLARFNVMTGSISKKFFIGLPIPAAACALAALVLFHQLLPAKLQQYLPWVTLGLTFVLALLMVSTIRYFSFKEFGFVRERPFRWLVISILLFGVLVTRPRIFGFSFFVGYLISGPIYTLFFMHRKRTSPDGEPIVDDEETGEDDPEAEF